MRGWTMEGHCYWNEWIWDGDGLSRFAYRARYLAEMKVSILSSEDVNQLPAFIWWGGSRLTWMEHPANNLRKVSHFPRGMSQSFEKNKARIKPILLDLIPLTMKWIVHRRGGNQAESGLIKILMIQVPNFIMLYVSKGIVEWWYLQKTAFLNSIV